MDSFLYSGRTDLKPSAGVFIDIDGVVLNGGKPFEWTKEAVKALWDNEIPFMFVTNGTYCSETLVNNLRGLLGLPFTKDHCVVAPSPCSALEEYHDKHVLVCCQEDSNKLVEELGFSSYILMSELAETFPELDYVDHNKRKELLKTPVTQKLLDKQAKFKPIECILLLGEPINWEQSLQLLLDVLMTNGDPRKKFKYVPSPHLPILACNKDLTFKGAAALPRFGHGAFLECLESLYRRVTNNELVYEQMMGKPFLVTYQYAANQIQRLAKPGHIVNKFFIVGDNPDVDIRGGNAYKEYLQSMLDTAKSKYPSSKRPSLAEIQVQLFQLNEASKLNSFKQVETVLVSTGVYNPQNDLLTHLKNLFNENLNKEPDDNNNEPQQMSANREEDIEKNELKYALSRKNSFISYFDNKLNIPDLTVNTLLDAVNYIVKNKSILA